jgi:hypothetical protein
MQGVGCCTQAMSSGATRDAVEFTDEDGEHGCYRVSIIHETSEDFRPARVFQLP